MKTTAQKTVQKITIGNKESDADLIGKIQAYMREKNIRYAADAVRKLCEDALAFKEAVK